MLKKNKLMVIISSIIILLPALFGMIMWNDLPDTMTTHFGADGNADGFSGKAFAVFGLPCILLVSHFICLLFTLLDKKQKEQNPKALGIIFWTIPILSLISNGVMYRVALGKEIDLSIFISVLLGIMFVFIGNYLPKIKQNRTIGIKVWWTVNNEENWNKTHRLAGKVWVVGGIILLSSIFLPFTVMVWIMLAMITVTVIIPIIYSYYIYKQHQKKGIAYVASPKNKAEKMADKISIVIVSIIIIGVAILMFTGDIKVNCEDTSFKINATFWTDLEISYSELDTIEYRKDLDVGERTNGVGSVRLSLGNFQNKEFGSYTLYAYKGAEGYIVLTSDGKTLVIGMNNAKDTQIIYDTILERMGK